MPNAVLSFVRWACGSLQRFRRSQVFDAPGKADGREPVSPYVGHAGAGR